VKLAPIKLANIGADTIRRLYVGKNNKLFRPPAKANAGIQKISLEKSFN
jgi:hypothetical protein